MSACCPSPRASFLSSFQLSSFGGCVLGSAAVGRRPLESADPSGCPACGSRNRETSLASTPLEGLTGSCGQSTQCVNPLVFFVGALYYNPLFRIWATSGIGKRSQVVLEEEKWLSGVSPEALLGASGRTFWVPRAIFRGPGEVF